MSDVIFYGVLRMPYEMAMGDELSRRQFYDRAQEAADRMARAETALDDLREVVGRLVKAKGRFHTEQNYKALVAAYDASLASASLPPGRLDIQALAANVRGAMQETGGDVYRQALYDTILQATAKGIAP